MTPLVRIWFAALAIATYPLVAPVESKEAKQKHSKLSHEERTEFFRSAQVWAPTNVAHMDLRTGPTHHGFRLDEVVDCEFVPSKQTGSSRKFNCMLPDGDVVKVRYGADNGEVEGSVLASRLLWALGFGADGNYPVRVVCHGCSEDPWNKRGRTQKTNEFDVAMIERKAPGHEMHDDPEGWSWTELNLVDDTQGGAPRSQRDALKLLAVFMQHSDNKPEQQRLQCLPGGLSDDGVCKKPFLYIHDVGLTFGHANYLNRTVTASVNFDEWSATPIWRDKEKCIGHLSKSSTGTLGDPKISEGGRAFLAGLLDQLTDTQLHDLFLVGHVDRRGRRPGKSDAPATIAEWVSAFKQKRAEIDATRCPAD